MFDKIYISKDLYFIVYYSILRTILTTSATNFFGFTRENYLLAFTIGFIISFLILFLILN